MIPDAVKHWLIESQYGTVVSEIPVSGGCISNGMILQAKKGNSFFLKVNPKSPSDMFVKESAGLESLLVEGGPVVPKPYYYGSHFLLMENLAPAAHRGDYWSAFGRMLAVLHLQTRSQFGFSEDNYIGSTPQPNPWMEDGYEFFGIHRLMYQSHLARERGLLGKGDLRDVESLVKRLPTLVPAQPPSLVHGDLWTGNALTDSRGAPAIIDPAAYFGWAEAELAMTTLFGSFPSEFYRAYEEIRPLEPDYFARFPIYNLYHLLNHLNIFGRGYLGQTQSVLKRYA